MKNRDTTELSRRDLIVGTGAAVATGAALLGTAEAATATGRGPAQAPGQVDHPGRDYTPVEVPIGANRVKTPLVPSVDRYGARRQVRAP